MQIKIKVVALQKITVMNTSKVQEAFEAYLEAKRDLENVLNQKVDSEIKIKAIKAVVSAKDYWVESQKIELYKEKVLLRELIFNSKFIAPSHLDEIIPLR